ncbi:MAG: alpha-mannosidase [Leptolyngbya sp. SIOISBB]|nr:alpha-mannosidase [Leptolyngbya sp. SIOISBB]
MADLSTAAIAACNLEIKATVEKLKRLTQRSLQSTWHISQEPLFAITGLEQDAWQQWAIATLNVKDHIAWSRGQQTLWLCQQVTVPEALNGFPLAGLSLKLSLTWWAEAAAVYVDGHLVQEGDLFDYFARIPLSARVTPGDTFTIAIRLVSPGHDNGALVRSTLMYESLNPILPEPGFIADELTVLQIYAAQLAPEKLSAITTAIAHIDWSTLPQQEALLQELAALRTCLQSLTPWIKQRQITCVGHAHLDLAWLWPVEDTWRAAERTFRSVLALQQDFPDMTYTHSSPALFDWLETHKPELFHSVLTAIKAGRWSIDAGLWVEPELNTLGGESLARQILYGQRYAQSRFGQVSAIAWLPDSFGFSWQLPQLLKLGGINYFATQKLRWNEATDFPHSCFWWQGLDGTQIMSLTLPPIGTDIDAPQMAAQGVEWEAKTGLTEMLWLPGMGDHGGGPTRDMLERAQRWAESPFFPRLIFDSPIHHLQRLTHALEDDVPPASDHEPSQEVETVANLTVNKTLAEERQRSHPDTSATPPPINTDASSLPLPIWNDELYLELHRGCYTVHADQKWYNRRCEDTLREAELYSAIAQMMGSFTYPQATLEIAWKRVLFNQFHDILPGTAIPEVFETANPDWQAAYDAAQVIRTEALGEIAAQLPRSAPPQPDAIPLSVFNSLSWEQTNLVEISLTALPLQVARWRVIDAATGTDLTIQYSDHCDRHDTAPCQPSETTPSAPCILFSATVPPLGYRQYWLLPATSSTPADQPSAPPDQRTDFCLENELVQAVIDPTSAELRSLVEQATQQNVVRSSANQLQAFADAGQYWDAWDIAPNYQQHPLPAATVESIAWMEQGPLRQRLRVVRHLADSRIQQDYMLERSQPYLKVVTTVDWQACQVVLKAAFPLSFEVTVATYEIPFGAIARPTNPSTPHEQAKWEVPGYRWAELNNGEIGLSVLTDYKHGFDAKPDQLRLTLLKAPLWPNPQADRGRHQFTYGLYPHVGDWRASKTPQQAIAFNTPLQVVIGKAGQAAKASSIPASHQGIFLDWQLETAHLAALKQAEDSPSQYILRWCDLYGQGTTIDADISQMERTDLLEETIAVADPNHLHPWQIASFKTSSFINKSLRNLPPPATPQ